MKTYRIWPPIGKVKYPVSFHDGVKTHSDGSPFNDARNFSNKRKLATFVTSLKDQGYTPE